MPNAQKPPPIRATRHSDMNAFNPKSQHPVSGFVTHLHLHLAQAILIWPRAPHFHLHLVHVYPRSPSHSIRNTLSHHTRHILSPSTYTSSSPATQHSTAWPLEAPKTCLRLRPRPRPPTFLATCRLAIAAVRYPPTQTGISLSWTLQGFSNFRPTLPIALKRRLPKVCPAAARAVAGAHLHPPLAPQPCLSQAWLPSFAALGARGRSVWTPEALRRPVPYSLVRICIIATGVPPL